jgi:hypothetical protein
VPTRWARCQRPDSSARPPSANASDERPPPPSLPSLPSLPAGCTLGELWGFMELGQRAAEPLDDAAKDDAFARLKRHALDGDVAFVASAPPRQNYARSPEKGKKKDVARVDEEELKKEDAFLEANAMQSDNKKLRCVRSPPPRPVHLPPPRDPARPPGENNNARARSQIPPRDEPNEPNERTNERTNATLPPKPSLLTRLPSAQPSSTRTPVRASRRRPPPPSSSSPPGASATPRSASRAHSCGARRPPSSSASRSNASARRGTTRTRTNSP